MYAPYGEERINQHPFFYRERFTFTGKERDAETGYDYFGARNYLSALSIWGAVDPLADKYIYNSPYVYCEGNPIIYIDPTGLYGYKNDDGDYQWYPNQVAESFTDETGKQWTLVAKNEKNFTEATTIRQAVVEGLIDSGYEGDAKNDVGLYKESSPLFTKEACFNGDISAFLSWDEKPNSDPTARKSSKAISVH